LLVIVVLNHTSRYLASAELLVSCCVVVYFVMDVCLFWLWLIQFLSTEPRVGFDERLQNDLFCVGYNLNSSDQLERP